MSYNFVDFKSIIIVFTKKYIYILIIKMYIRFRHTHTHTKMRNLVQYLRAISHVQKIITRHRNHYANSLIFEFYDDVTINGAAKIFVLYKI